MSHTFKLVIENSPYDLDNLLSKLNRNLKIPLNRVGIYFSEDGKNLTSINVNPFLPNYFGLQFTFRFINNDTYFSKVLKEDFPQLKNDFVFEQNMIFSYPDEPYHLDKERLKVMVKIVLKIVNEINEKWVFIYENPEKKEVFCKKSKRLYIYHNKDSFFKNKIQELIEELKYTL